MFPVETSRSKIATACDSIQQPRKLRPTAIINSKSKRRNIIARLHYFSNFPVVSYAINGGAPQFPIDITKRFTITQLLKGAIISYFNYIVQDGERPDIVAQRMYGDERLDWLVLLVNEIHDPYFIWPLSNENLVAFVAQKYGSVSVAMATTHHYEQIVSTRKQINNTDGELVFVPEITVEVDQTTYNALGVADRHLVNMYDYEMNINESRRNIALVDPQYLTSVIDQYKKLFR